MDTLITPDERKLAEKLAARDLTFYNEQAGKGYNQIFENLSGLIPIMLFRYQTRQRIAGRIYQSHKKGKVFKATHHIIENNNMSHFQIFTVFLSPNAPTYVNWDSAKIALRELRFAMMECYKKSQL